MHPPLEITHSGKKQSALVTAKGQTERDVTKATAKLSNTDYF